MLTDEMWGSISDVYSAIISHPFLKELADGTLGEEKFKYYIAQDHLYLKEFSRTLAVLSAKAPEGQGTLFAEHVTHVVSVERKLHQYIISRWGIKELPPSPTTLLYTSFLLSTVYSRPYFEGVSAVLPCYWLYMVVGKELKKRGSPREEYRRWIDTYSGEEYERGVRQVLDIVNSFKLTGEEKEEAIKKFRLASIMEYINWDSAYRLEKLPFSV